MPEEGLLQQIMDALVPFFTTYGVKVLGAIIILIVGKIVAGICGKIVKKMMVKAKAEASVAGFASAMVRYAIMIFAVIAALAKFGVQTGSFIAVIGAAGLAVGLALQGSLSNFAAGVLLLIFKPFKVGHFIDAAGTKGVVQEIGIFTTILHSPDNQKVIIPNSAITGGVITNVTANDTRRVDLTAGIAYGADMGKAKQVIEEMLTNHPLVLDEPAPTVAVVGLGDSSVDFVVRPWVKTEDYWDAYFGITRGIKEALDNAGIEIPFPQRDIHMYETAS